MKWIKHIFDAQRPHFSDGGKLAMLHPLFDAVETVFFTPTIATASNTHVRDNLDLKRFMSLVLVALMPPLLFGIYNTGYQSHAATGRTLDFIPVFISGLTIVMPILVVTYAVGLFWETVFARIRKHKISEGFLVTGLLFPLTLPPTIPLWQVAVGISFGVVIGKEIFGGTGRNFLNPALTGRAFLFFAYPAHMSGDAVWRVIEKADAKVVDAVSGATPLAIAGLAQAGDNITTLLNKAGYTMEVLVVGNLPGSIGETSALLCLVGAVGLMVVGVASYRIIIGGVLGVLATGYFLNMFAGPTSSALLGIDPFYHLILGSFAFGIAYMATDPVSAPGMNHSKWIYGFMIGVFTVLIRVFNPAYPEGVMLAILFMNLFSPLLDYFEIRLSIRKRVANV
ncbi:NADH:ubiquinone reductase (Na(+)-transporting) subunit B [Thermodesulfobacteriota bacterium]